MDKLLWHITNSKGLPNGPNYNRTGMLGKLSMFDSQKKFKHGGAHPTKEEMHKRDTEIDAYNKKYTNSPQFRKLMQNAGYTEEQINNRLSSVNEFSVDDHINYKNEGSNYVYDAADRADVEGIGDRIDYNLQTDLSDWKKWENIQAHEHGHRGVSTGENPMTAWEKAELLRRNKSEKNPVLWMGQKKLEGLKLNQADQDHDLSEQETRADLFQMRYDLNKSGIYDSSKGEPFTKEHLIEWFKKQDKGEANWNRLQRLYDEDNIIWMMNSIAEAKPKESSEQLPYAKHGGTHEPPPDWDWDGNILNQAQKKVNAALNYPMDKAVDQTQSWMNEDTDGNEHRYAHEDPIRHTLSGANTSEAIEKGIEGLPYGIGTVLDATYLDKAAAFLGANALGVGHEVVAYPYRIGDSWTLHKDALLESGKDMWNNAAGSLIGLTNETDLKKRDAVVEALKDGNLTTGFVDTRSSLPDPNRYKKHGGQTPVYVDGGEIKKPGDGWEYQKVGDQYMTKKTDQTDWIDAKGDALTSIKQNIYGEFDNALPAEQQITVTQPDNTNEIINLQQDLVSKGYYLGDYGPNEDGVDGDLGPKTQTALDNYNKGIAPQQVKAKDAIIQNEIVNKPISQQSKTGNNIELIQKFLNTKGYTLDEDGVMGTNTQDALTKYKDEVQVNTLPIFPTSNPREETCKNSGGNFGCSYQTSAKLTGLFNKPMEGKSAQNLWAKDAWFNKDNVLKNEGTLLYNTDQREGMGAVPKETYGILQVGDYVHLNRRNTKQSYDYMKRTHKDGLKNEGIEHMGLIVGKDADGTPLLWHGSETGKAYIKRLDEPLTLDDHKSLGQYYVSSIARSNKVNDEIAGAVAQNPYYMQIDKDNELLALDGATLEQRGAITNINDNIALFKNLGFDQEDVNLAGQVLLGGSMGMETKSGESTRSFGSGLLGDAINMISPYGESGSDAIADFINPLPSKTNVKYVGATVWKGWLGQAGENDIAEASRGMYQVKPETNFYEKGTTKLNSAGQKLATLGISPENFMDSEKNQTLAATVIMLSNLTDLKSGKYEYNRNPDGSRGAKKESAGTYDPKTKTWTSQNGKFTYPAAYILAGAWSAGHGWENRPKYMNMLNSTEGRDYAVKSLRHMEGAVTTEKGRNYGQEGTEHIVAQNKREDAINDHNRINLMKVNRDKEMIAAGYKPEDINIDTIAKFNQDKNMKAMMNSINTFNTSESTGTIQQPFIPLTNYSLPPAKNKNIYYEEI